MTYGELYRRGRDALEAAGVPEAELDARLLLEWVCGTDRNDLLAHGDRERSAGEQEEYERLISGVCGGIMEKGEDDYRQSRFRELYSRWETIRMEG